VRLLDGSGVNREVHAPFCERPGVQFLRPTCHQQHWVVDVQFGEDACRTRKDHSAENLALIRRLALNVLRHNGPPRDSIRRRKLRAALNDDYRLRLLLGTSTPATP
jgi:hypothetical protein